MPEKLTDRIRVVTTGGGGGPAAARNVGWRATTSAPWIAFLDDDVEGDKRWGTQLDQDLRVGLDIGGVQGLIRVPLPDDRRPSDWERCVAGLAGARWITADMAYRRAALIETGGFDERFGRAFREDADLALRVIEAGWRLTTGSRRTTHPVRPADRWISVRSQAGNADDVLMSRLHGTDWYVRAGAAKGRRARHLAITASAAVALAAATAGRRRLARVGIAGWLVGTAEFLDARVRPGPRTAEETATMAVTSFLIPPVATWQWLRGLRRYREVDPWPRRPSAVLFDRDGTLVRNVPFNTDPEAVEPMPGAAQAVGMLREAGLRVGVVTNQSGVGRGLISQDDLTAVNRRVDELLGPFDTWAVCVHAPDTGCDCRKPKPGLIEKAAGELGVSPEDCVIIGDIGADVDAARAAGARSVLVPTPETRQEELVGVRIAPNLVSAACWILRAKVAR